MEDSSVEIEKGMGPEPRYRRRVWRVRDWSSRWDVVKSCETAQHAVWEVTTGRASFSNVIIEAAPTEENQVSRFLLSERATNVLQCKASA